ncbi:MAG TPA: cytochrome b/b6 domain-containing protein [Methylocystis sp.]|nr:cytochrome b/b6 domain-containing protein [Methylocystis sp.]
MTTLETNPASPVAQAERTPHRLVWDWPVRFFHWSLVLAFLGAFVTNKLGVKYFTLHVWCGYAVIALVAFRIFWGFLGPRHARFASFVRGPKAVLGYLYALGRGRRTRYAGHNPVGALMVLTLLALLGAQAILGLFANDEIFNVGPLAGLVSKSVSLGFTSLHRKLFYWIAGAVALHVIAVVAHVRFKGENIVLAMITGKKPAHLVRPGHAIASSRSVYAVAIFVAVAAGLTALLQLAPAADIDVAGF